MDRRHGKHGTTCNRQFEHGASTSIAYITHAFIHGSTWWLYLRSVHFPGRNEFVEGSRGSSRSTMVVEVVVLSVLDGSGARFPIDIQVNEGVLGAT